MTRKNISISTLKTSMQKSIILLLFIQAAFASFYKKTQVLELDASNFDEVVLNSNHSALIEFYAPWCGHCQRLKNDYEKVGKYMNDVAIIGAVNCDVAKNKKICSNYRIEGFPTILAFRAPKYDLNKKSDVRYAHATEVYNGPRKTKPLVDFISSRIKNYVKRLITLDKLKIWINENDVRPKLVVFTRKDKLTSLLKSIGVDLLGLVDIAYFPLSSHKKEVLDEFNIDPNGSNSVIYYFDLEGNKTLYEGELNKAAIFEFLSNYLDLSKIYKRINLLKKVENGEKIKKSKKNHDEL